jgi:hypothetical protein
MRVFVSHASKDHMAVESVHRQLESIGVTSYLAEHDQRAGERLSQKVEQALRGSDLVVAILTPAGYDSRYVQQELGVARGTGTLIIPLVHPDLTEADLGLLNDIEYIRFDPSTPQDGLASLTERVADLARRQQARQDLIMAGAAVVLVLALLYLTPDVGA